MSAAATLERPAAWQPEVSPMRWNVTTEERFWRKVDRSGECWLWRSSTNAGGYGLFHPDGGAREWVMAHRYAYELEHGPIPEGLDLDHLCRTRSCVRAEHLEPVTHRENVLRGDAGKRQRERTHCPQGHEYAGENLYVSRGQRSCRICVRASKSRYRQRQQVIAHANEAKRLVG